jgi:hypothetical protein
MNSNTDCNDPSPCFHQMSDQIDFHFLFYHTRAIATR